jgi:hypothetical protein
MTKERPLEEPLASPRVMLHAAELSDTRAYTKLLQQTQDAAQRDETLCPDVQPGVSALTRWVRRSSRPQRQKRPAWRKRASPLPLVFRSSKSKVRSGGNNSRGSVVNDDWSLSSDQFTGLACEESLYSLRMVLSFSWLTHAQAPVTK